MSFDEDMFKQLPIDIQLKILVEELDPETFKNLCRTDTYFRKLCSNETLWKQQFQKMSSNAHLDQKSAYELTNSELTWLNKTRMLWILTHPKNITTISIDTSSGLRIIISYLTNDRSAARTCLIRDYNAKVEPVYTKLKSSMEKFLTRYTNMRYTTGNIAASIQTLTNIIHGRQPLNADILRLELMKNANEILGMGGISFADSILFDFRNGDDSISLYQPGVFYGNMIFTLTGDDWELFGKIMNLFVNQNSTFLRVIKVIGAYGEEIIRDFKRGNFNILTGTVRVCSPFSSLVPFHIPLPNLIPSPIADNLPRIQPLKQNLPLPPPGYLSPVVPPFLQDKRAFPPPKEWLEK